MKSKDIAAQRDTQFHLVSGTVIVGYWAVLELARIDGLEIAFDPKKAKGRLDLAVPPIVVRNTKQPDTDGSSRNSGRYTCIRRASAISLFIGDSTFATTLCFVVTEIPDEKYLQGLKKYLYFVEATRFHFPNPNRKNNCDHNAGGCLKASCCLAAILADPAIHEDIAYFVTGKARLLSKRELVQLFEQRISESMIRHKKPKRTRTSNPTTPSDDGASARNRRSRTQSRKKTPGVESQHHTVSALPSGQLGLLSILEA
jgi:hypothetical protein